MEKLFEILGTLGTLITLPDDSVILKEGTFCSVIGHSIVGGADAFVIVDGSRMLFIPYRSNTALKQFVKDFRREGMIRHYDRTALVLGYVVSDHCPELKMKSIFHIEKEVYRLAKET